MPPTFSLFYPSHRGIVARWGAMREEELKREMRKGLGKQRYSAGTIKQTVKRLQYLERLFGIDLDTVTLDELIDILEEFEEKGTPVKTLNGWVKYLNRYLLFRGLKKLSYFPQWENEDVFFYVPTDEDKDKILSVQWKRPDVHWRNHCMLLVLFDTGIRINELVHLNWSDIEITDAGVPILHIRHGKGAKQRIVPMHPSVLEKLTRYRKYYRLNTDPNAIFTSVHGRIEYNYARNLIKEAGRMAGVPQFHAHAARHWRAISWLKQGVDIETIRRFLGHKSLKSTEIYVKWMKMQDSLFEVIKKDKTFGGWNSVELNRVKKLKEVIE